MKKAKSIQQIYNEVKDCDIVLTNDAPLKTALNRLADRPMLGKFACTPREAAVRQVMDNGKGELPELIDLASRISEITGLERVETAHYINRISEICESTGSLSEVEQYLHGKNSLPVFKALREAGHPDSAREDFDPDSFFRGKKVAVIAPALFTPLDSRVLPADYISVDPFYESGEVVIPGMYTAPAEEDAAEHIISAISPETASRTAIVLDVSGSIVIRLRSGLSVRGIPVQVNDPLSSDRHVRLLLDLLKKYLNPERYIVSELFGSLAWLGCRPGMKHMSMPLSLFPGKVKTKEFWAPGLEILEKIGFRPLQETVKALRSMKREVPWGFTAVAEKLGLMDTVPGPETYRMLKFGLSRFDPGGTHNKGQGGVLLAGHSSSAWIDRPVVIYASPDQAWDHRGGYAPWQDPAHEYAVRQVKNSILFQQGQQRFSVMPLYRSGEENKLCSFLSSLSEGHKPAGKILHSSGLLLPAPIETRTGPVSMEPAVFSESSLNLFTTCPRKFFYSRFFKNPVSWGMNRGTLYHAFAELYWEYPEKIKAKGLHFFINRMASEYLDKLGMKATDYELSLNRLGFENIMASLDLVRDKSVSLEKALPPLPADKSTQKPNVFYEMLGLEKKRTDTECGFLLPESSLMGYIDLVINPFLIMDHKSSWSMKDTKSIVLGSLPWAPGSSAVPDLQALLYLHALSRVSPGRELEFRWNHFLSNNKKAFAGKGDITENFCSAYYYACTYSEFITTPVCLDIIASKNKVLKEFLTHAVRESFSEFMKENPIEYDLPFEKDRFLGSSFAVSLLEWVSGNMEKGDKKKTAKNMIEMISAVRLGMTGIRGIEHKAVFFSEDMDRFREFVNENNIKMKDCIRNGFPRAPAEPSHCGECEYASACLKGEDV